MRIITKQSQLDKIQAKPHLKRWEVLQEELALAELQRSVVRLDRPIYVGFSVLEESKVHMYRFHYQIMKPQYPDISLLFTDTDSLCYLIQTEDLYADFSSQLATYMDTSNFPRDHPSYSTANARVLGKFKEEQPPPNCVAKFVGLRPKLYALENADGSSKSTCKGVPRHKKSKFATYLACLQSRKPQHARFNAIRSTLHSVASLPVKKVAMSAFDDKRYVLTDGPTTRALQHPSSSDRS